MVCTTNLCRDCKSGRAGGYVPFNSVGHGVYSGGDACLFGYNYDLSYIPWVAPGGFYLKPHCKETF